MARIRTIKPGFWTHEALSSLPEPTHMLAAQLINYADDEGYFNANVGLIKAECCPLREPSVSIHCSLTELSRIGWIRLGTTADGRRVGQIVKFAEHQKINRPTKSKISCLSITWGTLTEPSVSPHGALSEPSLLEGKGREEEGKGKNSAPQGAADGAARVVPMKSPEARVYDRGREILGPSAGGLVTKLLRRHDGNPALAMASLEVASTKSDPREYIGAIIANHGDDKPDPRGEYGRDWG